MEQVVAPDRAEDATKESTAPLYFETLSLDVNPLIVTCLKREVVKKWHTSELMGCEGALGEAVQHSITELVAEITTADKIDKEKHLLSEEVDEEGLEKREIYVLAWNRIHIPESCKLIEKCRLVRSLNLHLPTEKYKTIVSLDELFACCGDVLEELYICLCVVPSSQHIAESIARHCRSLHTFYVTDSYFGASIIPLFRAIGPKLRRLGILSSRHLQLNSINMAQCFPVLEGIELTSYDLAFEMASISSLRIVVHCSYLPIIGAVKKLIERYPNVILYVNLRSWKYRNNLEPALRACGGSVHGLCLEFRNEPSPDLKSVVMWMIELRELDLHVVNKYSEIVWDAFFTTPKPELRKLILRGLKRCAVFDILAGNVSTLEEFSCSSMCTNFFGDADLSPFIAANINLRIVSISYFRPINGANTGTRSFVGRTTSLIGCMKRFPSFRVLNIDGAGERMLPATQSRLIADACVGLRRRGFNIVVQNVGYTE